LSLQFVEEGHKYTLDGLEIPSVTKVLNDIFPISDFVSKELLEEAGKLGKQVHNATELWDREILDYEELHPLLKAYLNSWVKFRKDYNFEPTDIELQLFHPVYKYAGRIDRVGFSGKDKILLDIKSGTKQKTHAYQTAAYEELFNYDKKKKEFLIKKRWTVYLSEDGYKVEPYLSPNDRNIFLACLTIYNAKRSK
jgi:hypothetical protein